MRLHSASDFERHGELIYFVAWEEGREVSVALDLADASDHDLDRLMATIIGMRNGRSEKAAIGIRQWFKEANTHGRTV